MRHQDVVRQLEEYVRERFLDGDETSELTPSTPLLEWGVLDSLNTAQIIGFIREQYQVDVPPSRITAAHFRDLESIAALVVDLAPTRAA